MKNNLFTIIILSAFLGWMGAAQSIRAESNTLEYKVKAAFLLNFAKFTSWPVSHFATKQAFSLCVLGKDPFGAALNGLETKQVAGKPVFLIRQEQLEGAMEHGDLLFIARSEQDHLSEILAYAETRGMVTVSDIEGFARAGGIYELKNKNGRLSFIINNSKAKQRGIQISSSLLKLAIEVL